MNSIFKNILRTHTINTAGKYYKLRIVIVKFKKKVKIRCMK